MPEKLARGIYETVVVHKNPLMVLKCFLVAFWEMEKMWFRAIQAVAGSDLKPSVCDLAIVESYTIRTLSRHKHLSKVIASVWAYQARLTQIDKFKPPF